MNDSKNIKIIQTVASGGTAVLFKAVQTSLDRVVAVKRLHQHLTNDENFTRRFILEAKAAASLDHENIVHVIDFGLNGDCYEMVMEYVEGESLSDILERWRPIKYDLALAIVHQICLGLEHAHSKGIVHRDIKPGNVMLTTTGRIKITDFGLAKLTQSATSQTAANSILGTPLYMSPEQAFGESVDQRSDLFSLGTVLYELLTGKQPFASENYMGVIQNIINKEIPSVQEVNPDVPDEVAAIVARALSKDRDERYQSAGQIRREIESYLGIVRLNELAGNLQVLLERNGATQVLSAPVSGRRKRRSSGGGIAALIVFLIVAGATSAALLKPELLDYVRDVVGSSEATQQAAVTETPTYHIDLDGLVPDLEPATGAVETVVVVKETKVPVVQPAQIDTVLVPAPEPEKEPEPAKPKPIPMGFLQINARPNAEIYVDGVYKGDTPPTLSLKLRKGEHKIECRHPRYQTYTEVLKIVTGELSRRDVTLRNRKGTISLATQEGAEIYIDGKLAGVTPITRPIQLDVGPHMVTIKKTGFFTWNSEVTIESNKTLPLRIQLSPRY